jgi:hypothetical protein
MQQFKQEFQQLGQDLQAGNLSAAQADFVTLQQLGLQGPSTSTAQSSSPLAQAFKQLSQDLSSGNLSAAQQDDVKIQRAIQSQASQTQGHHHHHHHHKRRKREPTVGPVWDRHRNRATCRPPGRLIARCCKTFRRVRAERSPLRPQLSPQLRTQRVSTNAWRVHRNSKGRDGERVMMLPPCNSGLPAAAKSPSANS